MSKEKKMMRIDDEIKKCLAEIMLDEKDNLGLKNNCIVSILLVKTSKDLSYCKVNVSIFCDDKEKVISVLNESEWFIRKLIAKRLNLRVTPKFVFVLDDRIDYVIKINNLLDRIK